VLAAGAGILLGLAIAWDTPPPRAPPRALPPNTSTYNDTLSMLMVRNEEAVVGRVIRSLVAHVGPRIFLCDTGSNDSTLERARAALPDVVIHELREPFAHFEQARNACKRALQQWEQMTRGPYGGRIEWVALPDADFEAGVMEDRSVAEPRIPRPPPDYDVNTIQIYATAAGAPHNSLHLLMRARVYFEHCRYRLWTHEYLDCDPRDALTYGYYNGFHFLDHADGSARPGKLQRDIGLLRAWLREVNETDLRPRALYYLGRAYEDNGQPGLALTMYERHNAEPGAHTNYAFYARYREALIRLSLWNRACDADALACGLETLAPVEAAFMRAYESYDGYFRREPLYWLALTYRRLGHYARCLLWASAALSLPPLDHRRIPLFLEPALHGEALRAEYDYCAQQLRAP